MSNLTAIVTEIERSSYEDGPGLRTVVFFKGCPLHCVWCHNPECISREPQLMVYPEKCIGCGMCEKGCFSGAKILCGKEMTDDEIFRQLLLDKDYYSKDGGVTFSGGEPLLFPEMLKSLIKKCKTEGIKTAAETSLCIFNREILASLDFVMADFKIWDNEKHQKFVGIDNEIIKNNFKKLDSLNIPFLVRTPIIPGINDSKEEIENIANFLKQFKNVVSYELLPYHPLGVTKQKSLGIEPTEFSVPTDSQMEVLKKYANLSRQN